MIVCLNFLVNKAFRGIKSSTKNVLLSKSNQFILNSNLSRFNIVSSFFRFVSILFQVSFVFVRTSSDDVPTKSIQWARSEFSKLIETEFDHSYSGLWKFPIYKTICSKLFDGISKFLKKILNNFYDNWNLF